MILRTILLVLSCVALETTEQILYRLGGRTTGRAKYWKFVSPAVAAHITRLSLWYLLLKMLPLGLAVPLMGMNYLAIALTAKFVFGERVDKRRWLGTAFVLCGILLVGAALE
jgi:undecaprenyl phosphate-alpha-L-ara4N flippase subunit ArnE